MWSYTRKNTTNDIPSLGGIIGIVKENREKYNPKNPSKKLVKNVFVL
jgi:hypothetical protein